jgi:diguanylate cyclase (GGDEF)-like protein/PAS domain S-box-containing protein
MNWNLFQWHSLKTRTTLTTLGIFVVSLWVLSLYASRVLREDMERLLGEQQYSTVSLLAAQINRELENRLKALERVAEAATQVMPQDPAAMQAFVDQRLTLHILFNGGLNVVGPDGTAIADYPLSAGRIGNSVLDKDDFEAVFKQGKAAISQPVLGKTVKSPAFATTLKSPVFSMTVPLRSASGTVIGALSGVTSLGIPNFLDQITENSYGKTGGYLLVAPAYRLIVTATDKSRIMETLDPAGISPLIDRFIQGHEGPGVTINPRGVEVLAAAKSIPAAGWYAVATLPTDEAFAPIRDMQRRMLLATLLLTLLAGGLTWWLLRRQLSPLLATVETLARMSDTRQPLQALPVHQQDEIGQLIGGFNRLLKMLGQREALLNQVLDTSSVAIFLVDQQGRITQGNQRMAEMFGYPSGQLVGMEYVALVHPSERATARERMLVLLNSTLPLVDMDRLYWRADQSEFWGHLTGRRFYDASGEACGLVGVIADISVRKQAEQSLLKSKAQYDNLVSKIPVGIYTLRSTPQGYRALDYASPRMSEILGMSSASLLADAEAILGAIHPDDLASFREADQGALRQRQPLDWTGRVVAGGAVKWLHITSTPETLENDDVLWHGLIVDVSERMHAEEKLHLAASVFTHAREAILITAPDGTIIDVNGSFTRITGYRRDEILGANPRLLSSGRQDKAFFAALWQELIEKGYWHGEIWNRRKSGEVYATMQTISAVRDELGHTRQYVGLFSDITALKTHEKQLEHMAHYDVLTTLPNRVLLASRLHQAMAQAKRRRQRLAVVYLDLDGFKAINDRYGHKTGDRLLMALAARMQRTLREGDTLARLGGDEFVAVLFDLDNLAACIPMLNRLLVAAAEAVPIDSFTLQVSASLGVTFYPQPEEVDADQLLRQADQAMYQAKLAGKDRYHIFDADQDRSVRGHHEGLEQIRRALTAREFVLYYQPKVNMRTGTVIGAEALIRWQHPERGLLLPGVFLPVMENHPLAIETGEWVIATALQQIEAWRGAGLDMPVSVNVGAYQLQQADFVERLQALLLEHPAVRPGDLALEVIETSALEDLARVSQIIEACRGIGVNFSLDDFGTGYSSLTYLKRLQVTQLKIDQSFVREMLDDPDDLAILGGVLSLATAFRRQVIAEGVETVAHGTMLLQLGCELAQGYGIARPMPASDFPGWAQGWRPATAWSKLPAVNRDDLPLLFAGVEHRAWIVAIEAFLRGERASLPLIHHQCRFGEWLAADGLARHGGRPEFLTIGPVHRQMHGLAGEICQLQMGGRNAEAAAGLARLHGLRDALLAQLKALVEGHHRPL